MLPAKPLLSCPSNLVSASQRVDKLNEITTVDWENRRQPLFKMELADQQVSVSACRIAPNNGGLPIGSLALTKPDFLAP
jgi:6-phosphogluconolactonase (cycloisomerase 2 family)